MYVYVGVCMYLYVCTYSVCALSTLLDRHGFIPAMGPPPPLVFRCVFGGLLVVQWAGILI